MEMNGGAKEAQVKQHLSCGVAARVGCYILVGGNSYHDWYSPVSNVLPTVGCALKKMACKVAKGEVVEMPVEGTSRWYFSGQ